MGGGSSWSFRTLFGTLVVMGFILVMLLGILQSEGNKTKTTLTTNDHRSSTSTSRWTGKLQQREEQVKVLGKGKPSAVHPQLDLNYMSKRRVPNGPDPIHNRRAGNSKRPPGQA